MKTNLNTPYYFSFLLLTLFSCTLIFSYVNSIVPIWGHSGFQLEFSISKTIICLLIYIFFINPILYKLYSNTLYYFMIFLITASQIIPDLILYSLGNYSYKPVFLTLLILPIALTLKNIKFKTPNIILKLKRKKINWSIIYIALTIALLIPIILVFKLNINFNLLLLQDIYLQRSLSRESTSSLMGYTIPWLAKILIPTLMIFFLSQKKKVLALTTLILLVYIFLVTGHKSYLFSIFIILFLFIFSKKYHLQINKILILYTSLILLGIIIGNILEINMISGLITRRIFFIPSLLKQYYFEYFSNIDPLYLSESIFRSFTTYNLPESIPNTIGYEYFNSWKTNANNGIISDGYINFGIPGVIIYEIILCILLLLFSSANISPQYTGLFFLINQHISNGYLSTLLLTNGGFLLIILSLTLLKNTNRKIIPIR